MVYVTASPSKHKLPPRERHDSAPLSPTESPTVSRSNSSNVLYSTLNTIKTMEKNQQHPGQPISLSFLHKKRHSDSEFASTASPSTASSAGSSPKLVRKKSGELVKSSLKLNSLAGISKSMPTTPTYNKSVHFGVDVAVRYFDEKDKPTAVSANASPVLRAMAKKSKACFDVRGEGSDDDDDDDDDNTDLDEDENEAQIVWDMQTMNFSKIKYNEKFNEGSKLFLEKLILDESENCIIGTIAAKNLSFQKFIHVRYTFDCWRTVIEIEALFTKEVTRILKRANYDRFVFKIPLERFELMKNDQTDISFCIRYRYGAEEIWDNNYYKNYQVRLLRSRKVGENRSSKLLLNDYFSGDHQSYQPPTTSTIDSYFNNYEMLRSPETPKVLKNNENLLDTPEFKDLNNQFSDVSDSVNKLSLYSDKSNTDLLKYKENTDYTTVSVPPHLIPAFLSSGGSSVQQTPEKSAETTPEKQKKVSKTNKPPINSKSYQELLDSYCFYKSGGPTTVSSYLGESLKDS